MNLVLLYRSPSRRSKGGLGARSSGYTLLELTITTLIIALILVLISQILMQSTRLSQASVGLLLRSNLERSAGHLRHDAQSARAISPSLTWSSDPLTILLQEETVRYTLVDGHLTRKRTSLDKDTPETTTQTLAPLDTFRWRSEDGANLWVEWSGTAVGRSKFPNPVLTQVEIGLMKDRTPVRRFFHASRRQRSRGW